MYRCCCERKEMQKLKPEALLNIFQFLDHESLQNVRCSSSLANQLVIEHMQFSVHLEMVQVWEKDEHFYCRCLPRNGVAKTRTANTLEDAFEWLVPMLRNAHIQLFSLKNLQLTEDALYILMTVRAAKIQNMSMIGVSLIEIAPKFFHRLLQDALVSQSYSFNSMRMVHAGHFSDELLESQAFMQATSIEIDCYDFQMISIPCLSIYDRSVLEWFFNGNSTLGEFRILSCNRLKLGPYFVAEMVKLFCEQTVAKPTSLILCGRLIQCRRSFGHMVDQLNNGMEIVQARNETTGEVLRIQLLLTEKIEISRSFPTLKQNTRCRPVGHSARAVFA